MNTSPDSCRFFNGCTSDILMKFGSMVPNFVLFYFKMRGCLPVIYELLMKLGSLNMF